MYCPNCGSNNQAEIKFCTRCGTNLNVVSEALSGKFAAGPQIDERMVELLKDYYVSRRSMLIGGGLLIPLGAAILIAMAILHFPETLAVVALIALGIGLTIYGAMVGFSGIRHWIDSTSEMAALKSAVSESPSQATTKDHPNAVPLLVSGRQYSTDPIKPGSVTEQTTRLLDESDQPPALPAGFEETH